MKVSMREMAAILMVLIIGCWGFLSNPYLNTAGTDSSIFLYVAHLFNEGFVPYKDVFDQKGPLIFLIDAIGLRIGGGSFLGIWFLDCFAYLGAVFLSVKLCSKFVEWKYVLYMAVPFAAIYHLVACGGNMPEMYIIVLSLIAYNICINTKSCWSCIDCLIMGMSIGLILMLKLNMIIVIVPIIIRCFLGANKFKNIVLMMLGCLIAVSPFLIYLWLNDALNPFWEIYVEYNSQYARPCKFLPENNRGCLIISGIMVINALECFNKSLNSKIKSVLRLNMIYLFFVWYVVILSGGTYRYYGPILPACVLPISVFLSHKRWITFLIIGLSCILLFAVVLQRNLCYSDKCRKESLIELSTLINNRKSVTVLGCDCLAYLYLGVMSPTRFPYQGTIAHKSGYYRDMILQDIINQKSDYLIIPHDVLNTAGALGTLWAKSAVIEKYKSIAQRGPYSLYVKRKCIND